MNKITKNIHSYSCSASTYRSLLVMRKQQIHPFTLQKKSQSDCDSIRKSRHPICCSMLMPHNLCCFYLCNTNWHSEGFGWEGFEVGIIFKQNMHQKVSEQLCYFPICHQMHKENCFICNSPLLSKFSQSKLYTLLTIAQRVCFFLNEQHHNMILPALWHITIEFAPT